jgi:CheY-like chemotaxis protein
LLHYQCSVESTPRGEQALLMLQHTGYDALLSDIRLPDMSGFQLLLRLRDFYNQDDVPLVLTKGFGYDADHVMVKARQAGHNAFLYKPFRADQLLEALEAVIQ